MPRMTAGKKKYAAVEDKMQQIMTATKLLQEEMLAMAQEDADMYSLVLQAYKLPKDTEEEAAQRAKAIEEASKTAVVASLGPVSRWRLITCASIWAE